MKQEKLNSKLPTFLEICENAQVANDPVQYLKECCTNDKRVTTILGYCANPAWKIPLPEGTPPYQPSSYPTSDLAEITILHQHDKLQGLFNKNMKAFKREELWVNWLERMHDREAEIMNMIKDQTMHLMFSAITKTVIAETLNWPLDQFRAMCAKFKVPV